MAILSHSWETDPSTWILCYEGVGLVGETAVLFTIAPAMVFFVSCKRRNQTWRFYLIHGKQTPLLGFYAMKEWDWWVKRQCYLPSLQRWYFSLVVKEGTRHGDFISFMGNRPLYLDFML